MSEETLGATHQDADLRARLDQLEHQIHRLSHVLEGASNGYRLPYGATPVHPAARELNGVSSPTDVFGVRRYGFEANVSRQLPQGFPGGRARLIRDLIRKRRQREQYLPADLFADPAWDMMLDLYAAYFERRPVAVSSLCIAAAVPATTALRWIKTLTDAGLFVRIKDPDDGRRIYIHLSDHARERLDEYFDNLES